MQSFVFIVTKSLIKTQVVVNQTIRTTKKYLKDFLQTSKHSSIELQKNKYKPNKRLRQY
jgi:hypothetical protein